MEEVKNETKQTKTQVFNVVILDKSGSMESIRKAAISGFNETLAGIKIDAKELKRLQILSGHIDEPGEFIPDSVYVGPDYLEADTVAISE